MKLTTYNPFSEIEKMEQDLNKLWSSGFGVMPTLDDTSAMDLYEENGKLVAEVSLPGYTKDEVKVNADEGVLEVTAVHKEKEEKQQKRRYFLHESRNHYFRRIALPNNVKADKANAEFKDGILKVTIPMTKAINKAKHITVK